MQQLDNIKKQVEDIYRDAFVEEILNKLKQHYAQLDGIENRIHSFYNNAQALFEKGEIYVLRECDQIQHAIQIDIKNLAQIDAKYTIENDLNNFHQSITELLNDLPEKIKRVQDPERFKVQANDSRTLAFQKGLKRAFFTLSLLPTKISNVFTKNTKAMPQAWHIVPLRNLTSIELRDKLTLALLPILREVLLEKCKSTKKVWELSEELGININNWIKDKKPLPNTCEIFNEERKNTLEHLQINLRKVAITEVEKAIRNFNESYHKVDTIELSADEYNNTESKKAQDHTQAVYSALQSQWNYTLLALKEEWDFHLELYGIRNDATIHFMLMQLRFANNLSNNIGPKFNVTSTFFKEKLTTLQQFDGKQKELLTILKSFKNDTVTELNKKYIPQLISITLDQNFPALLDNIEVSLKKDVDAIDEHHWLSDKLEFNKPMKMNELKLINPKELVMFELLPQFNNVIKQEKNRTVSTLQKIQQSLMEIAQVADFNLDSAIQLLEGENTNKSEKNAKDVAIEGLQRSLSKLEKTLVTFEELRLEINNNLQNAINIIGEGLINLTNTDTLFQFKLKLAKSKTLTRGKELKLKILDIINNTSPSIKKWVKDKYEIGERAYHYLLKRIGFEAPLTEIPLEISDFIAETNQAIEKLPYVYQRMFRSGPLTDSNLFEGRVSEMQQMQRAFTNWQNGRYAPIAVVGEKGSGKTTLINFFESNNESKCKIIRNKPAKGGSNNSDLLSFFKTLLKNDTIESLTEVVEILNAPRKKTIIIVDDAHNLMLKKVGGFEAFSTFVSIIDATSINVLWVLSVNIYSWQYLCKTIGINDYFANVVKLLSFTNTELVELIMKRHRISGYSIEFEIPEEFKENSKFKNTPKEQQQLQLKKEYFDKLTNYAKSNLSMALLFWLRSTKDVGNDTIIISSQNPDFTFLRLLNNEKVFALHNVILHEGIDEIAFSEVSTITLAKAKSVLSSLRQIGVLNYNQNVYTINPLLYRHIATLLTNKNILH